MRLLKLRSKRLNLYILGGVIILACTVAIFARMVWQTSIYASQERINLVWYGPKTIFFSLSTHNENYYAAPFYSDLRMHVPGGYGYYRVGALGKLIEFEQNPKLLLKTFSSATASFVSFYFIEPEGRQISYGNNTSGDFKKPSFLDILLQQSNASLSDRIYLIYLFNKVNSKNTAIIDTFHIRKIRDQDMLLQSDFMKSFQGLWYQKSYRNEHLNVQILYSKKYKTAVNISNILEGNGIKVSDISYTDHLPSTSACTLKAPEPSSYTLRTIKNYFHCNYQQGHTGIYDIIFELNQLEADWEIR